MDHSYAKQKLSLLVRDIANYTDDEFRRQMARIVSGATGQDIPDDCHTIKADRDSILAELQKANATILDLQRNPPKLTEEFIAEIKAGAGQAGYLACAKEYGVARMNGSEKGINKNADMYSLSIKFGVSEAMLGVAVEWLHSNNSKSPQFSVACGLVFNDNDDADYFDSHMSEVAYSYGLHLSPIDVVKLFSIADQYAAKIRNTGTWLKDSNVNGGKRGGEK